MNLTKKFRFQQKDRQTERKITAIHEKLADNMKEIEQLFSDTPDLIIRFLQIRQSKKEAAIVYISSINDSKAIYEHIISPLLFYDNDEKNEHFIVPFARMKTVDNWQDVCKAILNGECLLFINDVKIAYVFETQDFPKRAIEDTPIESSITGSHVGFTESANDNIALLRKQIHDRQLKMKQLTVGKRGKTSVTILYLADVAHPELLNEIIRRMKNIDIDNVMNSGELAEYIEDHPFSPFPQLLLTERPDFAAHEILQGRFAIVVDRSPNVIICPVTFDTFFKTSDDYSTRWIVASFIRLLRYFAFFIAIFLPAFYIAVISFHFEIIPLELLLSVGKSRERIPFPPYIEAFIMEITLEMLREAGVRLPAKIGQTIGIVGGIVIGQAAVEAGIVSNIMVIVVALTAIASFIIPNFEMGSTIRIVRFPMMLLAMLFGIAGIIVGLMILLAHFITLKSLTMPFSMLRFTDLKDIFIRLPRWMLIKRPDSTKAQQKKKGNLPR